MGHGYQNSLKMIQFNIYFYKVRHFGDPSGSAGSSGVRFLPDTLHKH